MQKIRSDTVTRAMKKPQQDTKIGTVCGDQHDREALINKASLRR